MTAVTDLVTEKEKTIETSDGAAGRRALVIVSGGLDSAVLLKHVQQYRPETHAVSFNYGQKHSRELEFAVENCRMLGVPHNIINLTEVSKFIQKGSQMQAEVDPPDGHYTELSMKQTIVPNRNAIMISIACGMAVTLDIPFVYYGAHAGDHAIYPDCRPVFYYAMRDAMYLGNEWTPVYLNAPFIKMSKAQIVGLGHQLDVHFRQTWSCYKGGHIHCGTCGTCVERREAFELAHVPDPTAYGDTSRIPNPAA
jgi:7-cyano-7-deazaguanine synthase